MNKIIIETFNYITICYVNVVESVKLMVQEHYDTPEYNNTIFFINVLPNDTPFDGYLDKQFDKKIYYMLEHKTTDDFYYSSKCNEWDCYYMQLIQKANITEMWTMDYRPQFAVRCEQEFGIPIIYMPVRYTSLIKPVDNIYNTTKTVDYCHVGVITENSESRYNDINGIEQKRCVSLKCITQVKNLGSITPELNLAKYVIDIPRDDSFITQNQVRIFELLCMGYTICSKKAPFNMFPGLIYEWENIDDLVEIVKKGEYLHPTEAYREMTYTDEAYEQYVNKLIELQS